MLSFDPNGPVVFEVASHGAINTRFLSWVPTISGTMLELWIKGAQSFSSTGTGTDQVARGYVAYATQSNVFSGGLNSNIMFSLNVNGTLTVRNLPSNGVNNPLPAPTIINA
jgi:hypothetical protein